MRNSDPRVRTVFVYRFNSNFLSTFTLQATGCNFQYGPILVFPLIQPFGSDESSPLGKVYSRQSTASLNCENSPVSFVMKYCPTSTVFRNPASVQNLISLFCCDNFSIRSQYLCNRNSLCAGSSFKSMFVLITLGTNDGLDCPLTTGLPVLS